jgi:hypothetical protein
MNKMMKEEIEEDKIDIETPFILATNYSPEELNERLDILQYLILYSTELSKDKLKIHVDVNGCGTDVNPFLGLKC